MGTSIESTSPAPTSAAYSAVNQTSWGDYDPAQAWDNESSVLPTSTNATTVGNAYNGINDDYQQQQQTIDEYRQHSNDLNDDQMNNDNYRQSSTSILETIKVTCDIADTSRHLRMPVRCNDLGLFRFPKSE